MIDSFRGERFYLSNFYLLPRPMPHDGLLYWTSEGAFAAAKSLDFRVRWEISQIKGDRAGAQAKYAGRQLVLRPDWEPVCGRVMYEVVLIKFALFRDLAAKLVDTYPQKLVEGNTWHDLRWGKCTCAKHEGQGENRLGFILELVRQQLMR